MQLTVLTDNHAGAGFLAEHGLSFLVELENQKVLFDTGHTDIFRLLGFTNEVLALFQYST
jgi:7,8-dihydropterin-6-yl-methyl-4-(beta-D-ribofuranosyl)aminobenzene 5'-phosphate synthase